MTEAFPIWRCESRGKLVSNFPIGALGILESMSVVIALTFMKRAEM